MREIAVQVRGISKKYRIRRQAREPYVALRDVVAHSIRSLFRARARNKVEDFWALKDISFDARRGEVIGIVGGNGAGKSTLLKILSRITEPTSGSAIVDGRTASLLEVGTGFHAELTGRENIFLNGAILGMTRSEVQRKFDEIVAFAEIEQFLDTPVKRYSSGMYMRLAFAVAANLNTEILIVDEVLAVGDAAFQKKCLGSMETASRSGRTVLFVSHNINAVLQLCDRCILLKQGQKIAEGATSQVVAEYLAQGLAESGQRTWADDGTAPGFEGKVFLRAIRSLGADGGVRSHFDVTEPFSVQIEYDVVSRHYCVNAHLYFYNERGQTVMVAMDSADSPYVVDPNPEGHYTATCHIPGNLLNEGTLRIEYLLTTLPSTGTHATVPDALFLSITDDRRPGGARGAWAREWPAAVVRPRLKWEVRQECPP